MVLYKQLSHQFPVTALLASLMVLAACSLEYAALSRTDQPQLSTKAEWESAVRGELRGRSFLDFSSGLSLWAQYAEDGHAINEWEIWAENYSIEGNPGDTTFTIFLDNPSARQEFPATCEGCMETEGISLSIRSVFSRDKIAFRVNDPERVLPLPFPVFRSWTRFQEDEFFDSPILNKSRMRINRALAQWENLLTGRLRMNWQIAGKATRLLQAAAT